MRVSELLGAEVVGPEGPRGVVTDVRLAQVGAAAEGQVAAGLEVESLLVSRRHSGALFGYERGATTGPWLIRWAVRALHRDAFLIDWDDVSWDSAARRVTTRAGSGRPALQG